jgi:heme/copper-type cytochrome/quinol oxidase subunit 2
MAGAAGIAVAISGRGRFAPTAALCWGLAWVAVARLTGTLVSIPTAIASIVAVVAVVLLTVVVRLRESHAIGRARADLSGA